MKAGYSLITLDSFTATINPTEYQGFHAIKKVVDVATLTETITQHWHVRSSDKTAWLIWKNMVKSEVDALVTLYNADYNFYVFTDVYGDSHNVVIVDMPPPKRKRTLDSYGYELQMTLKKV